MIQLPLNQSNRFKARTFGLRYDIEHDGADGLLVWTNKDKVSTHVCVGANCYCALHSHGITNRLASERTTNEAIFYSSQKYCAYIASLTAVSPGHQQPTHARANRIPVCETLERGESQRASRECTCLAL